MTSILSTPLLRLAVNAVLVATHWLAGDAAPAAVLAIVVTAFAAIELWHDPGVGP